MDNRRRRGRSAAVSTNGEEDGTWSLRHGSEECAESCENAMMTQIQRSYGGTPRGHYLSRSNIDLTREKPVSRLVIMQARFQQRQLQEKEEKLLRLYEEQQERQERALQRVKGPGAQTDRRGPSMATTVGAGKVRTLLQCRRDHGRDKSYPLEPLSSQKTRKPKPQNVIYFGGSHQDLRFSDELDYGQSFQVINDQLVYNGDDDDFYLKDFQNKREFYEHRFSGEDHYNDPFQKLPNVGRMSQKVESPTKFKTFVSGKTTIGAGRSALPMRTVAAPAKKSPITSPPMRKPAPKLLETQRNGFSAEEVKKSNGSTTGSPPPRPPTGRKTVTPPQRAAKPDTPATMAPPIPASRTTIKPAAQRVANGSPALRQSPGNSSLVPCKNCGRSFATDRVGRHESICKKTALKKRKVFETVKQRVEGTEAAKYVLTGINERNAKKAEKAIAAKSNWRLKHEEFINNIRAAKEVQEHLKKGGKLSDLPPPPPSDYSDYVQCPHCQRKFNENAAARHIPACANMMHNKPRPAPGVRSTSTFRKK